MGQKLSDRGICGTCIYRSDCFYLKHSMKEGKPIMQCEEFDDSKSRKEKENLYSLKSFATGPCFSVKGLITGWGPAGGL